MVIGLPATYSFLGGKLNSTFWLGLVLGAIFGTVLGFMSRPLNRFFDRRLEVRAQVRGEQLRHERVGNREAVRDFLVLQILETTFIGAITGIVSGALFGVSNLTNQEQVIRVLSTAGQLTAVVGAVLIFRIAGDAIIIGRAARAKAVAQHGSDSASSP
jgi:drug/metabolite transporter (DMT)-like permease